MTQTRRTLAIRAGFPSARVVALVSAGVALGWGCTQRMPGAEVQAAADVPEQASPPSLPNETEAEAEPTVPDDEQAIARADPASAEDSHAKPSPTDSTPTLAGVVTKRTGVSSFSLPGRARERRTLTGVVNGIRKESYGWWVIELRGAPAQAKDERSFHVLAHAQKGIPLARGDRIEAHIDCTRGGWHYVCSGTVTDASGDLLFGVAGDGKPDRAPPWTLVDVVRSDPSSGEDGRRSDPIILAHPEGTITTRTDGWLEVQTTEGHWLVSGAYSYWAGTGPRPPESSSYTTYAITRLRK